MSKAFDTNCRDRLMEVLNTFMTEEEVRMVRVLLANTQLTVRVSNHLSNYFPTTIGTPQGDSLSPVLFTVYLEAALREVRLQAPQKVVGDIHLIRYYLFVKTLGNGNKTCHEKEQQEKEAHSTNPCVCVHAVQL